MSLCLFNAEVDDDAPCSFSFFFIYLSQEIKAAQDQIVAYDKSITDMMAEEEALEGSLAEKKEAYDNMAAE